MARHLSDIEIEAYRSRTAPPEQLLAVNDHLAECDECYSRFGPDQLHVVYHAISSDLKAALQGHVEHPDYEQLVSYVKGTLGAEDNKFLSAHVESCAECRSDAREMTAIEARIQDEAKPEAPKVAAPEKARVTGPAAWGRIRAYFREPAYRFALELACFVLLFAVALSVVTTRSRLRIADLESRVNQLEQENNSLQRKADATDRLRANAPTLADGNYRIKLDERGSLTGLESLPAAYQDLVRAALTTGAVTAAPAPKTSLGQRGALLGTEPRGENFEVLFPVSTAVEETRPAFKWQALPAATSYTVFVKDAATGEELESQPIRRTTWTPDKQLARGHEYAWMVEATSGNRSIRAPAPDKPFASFKVLDAREVQEISDARKNWGDSHLVMGLLYARVGLRSQAEKEFRDLVAANPESATAKSLLASVEVK